VGRSRGGLTTKIHLVADSAGRPLRFLLTPGQAADITSAPELLAGLKAKAVIADKGYDSRTLRDLVRAKRMRVVIPSKANRKRAIRYDKEIYKQRNLVERCFNKLKHFRRISTRFDRLDCHFMGALHLAATMIWLK
jgi:transposase